MPIESPSCLLAKMGYPKNNQYGLDGCHFSLARDDQRGRRARGAADATFNTVRK